MRGCVLFSSSAETQKDPPGCARISRKPIQTFLHIEKEIVLTEIHWVTLKKRNVICHSFYSIQLSYKIRFILLLNSAGDFNTVANTLASEFACGRCVVATVSCDITRFWLPLPVNCVYLSLPSPPLPHLWIVQNLLMKCKHKLSSTLHQELF